MRSIHWTDTVRNLIVVLEKSADCNTFKMCGLGDVLGTATEDVYVYLKSPELHCILYTSVPDGTLRGKGKTVYLSSETGS